MRKEYSHPVLVQYGYQAEETLSTSTDINDMGSGDDETGAW